MSHPTSPYPPLDTRQALSAESDGCRVLRPAEGLQRLTPGADSEPVVSSHRSRGGEPAAGEHFQSSEDRGQVHSGALAGGPPTSNTGVGIERVFEDSTLYGWDWTATTHDSRDGIVRDLLQALGAHFALPGKGLQGWSTSVQGFDREGHRVGSVYFGGGRSDVHVVSTSTAADTARASLIGFDRARTSRVDTRVDTLVPFADLVRIVESSGSQYGSRITWMESAVCGGEALGRTVYLGSPKSAVRVRVYEKWLESPGQYVEGTNRVEVQLRPPSKVKERVSSWSRAETFCASRVTRDLAVGLGDDLAPAASLHVRKPVPDLERTVDVMGSQYGPAVRRWLEFSGGDLGKVLDALGLEGVA